MNRFSTFGRWLAAAGMASLVWSGSAFAQSGGATAPSAQPAYWAWAATPPMGWNSYDAFGDSVSEAEVLANATYLKDHLLQHGWRYVVVDFRWYDGGANSGDLRQRTGATLAMDEHGRLMPAVNRFPSASGGAGFGPLAEKIHGMGLKFGIHIMRGIARQAVKGNFPIEGSNFTTVAAADLNSTCAWCPDMFGVEGATAAGQAWYDSLFRQYASWGVDYVKVDDLSRPYHAAEIAAIRVAIDRCGRAIVFSTSPGETPIAQASDISVHANLWRISDDFWDNWKSLNHNFDLLGRWQGVGGPGHWPDADMIPLGRVAIRSIGKPRWTQFTRDEQVTLMSLWALAPSPLMLGMNLPEDDAWTDSLLTNDAVIGVNQDALGAAARRVEQDRASGTEVWVKRLSDGGVAVGLFNRGSQQQRVVVGARDLGISGTVKLRDLWTGKVVEMGGEFGARVAPHGAMLLRVEK